MTEARKIIDDPTNQGLWLVDNIDPVNTPIVNEDVAHQDFGNDTSDLNEAQKQQHPRHPGFPAFEAGSIPVENRLALVADEYSDDGAWLTVGPIANSLGVNDRWVFRLVKEIGIESYVETTTGGREIRHYAPYATAVLREEREWRETFNVLPYWISAYKMAGLLGRSEGWTKSTLARLGVEPVLKPWARTAFLYPKVSLITLRQINLSVSLDQGWLTAGALTDIVGCDRQWALAKLKATGVLPEERRSVKTGKVSAHFPPQTVDLLHRAQTDRPRAGGDWLTAAAISDETGKSLHWVKNRLIPHNDVSEIRLDDMEAERRHFPPEVARILIAQAAEENSYPEAGDYMSLSEVRRAIGRASIQPSDLREAGAIPEKRRSKIGRVLDYYSPEAVADAKPQLTTTGEAKQISADDLVIAMFAVGSLRSQLAALTGVLRTLKSFGESADPIQINDLHTRIVHLRREYKKAYQRNYHLQVRFNTQQEQ